MQLDRSVCVNTWDCVSLQKRTAGTDFSRHGWGLVHQSSALLVQDNPSETLNLSSALGRPNQSPVPYSPDPIIDSYPVCLFVCSEVAFWLIGNRYKHRVSHADRQWLLHWSVLQWAVQLLSLQVLDRKILLFPNERSTKSLYSFRFRQQHQQIQKYALFLSCV